MSLNRPWARSAASFSRLALLATLAVGCRNEVPGDPPPPGPQVRPVISSRQVAAQGKLMPASGIISLSAVPGDQIESILVRTGQRVEQGDVLVIMRSNQLRQIELEAAETRLAEARLQLQARRTEASLGRDSAELRLKQARLAADQATKQLEVARGGGSQLDLLRQQIERLRKLRNNPQTRELVGQSDLDAKELELQRATQLYEQSLLTALQAQQTAELAVQLAEQSLQAAEENLAIVSSSASIDSLEKQIELLEAQLELTRISAPSDGTVLTINASVGELAGPTPILELGDLSNMVCVAEVHEADVARVSAGDPAVMTSAALPEELRGEVIEVQSLVGAPQMRLPNPLARTDFRAVPVRIGIAPEQQGIAAALVQLQVDVILTPQPPPATR